MISQLQRRCNAALRALAALSIVFACATAALGQPTTVVPISGHGGNIEALAFGPRGNWLATAGGGTVKIWDVEGRLLRTMVGDPAFALAQDGSVVTASMDHALVLFEVETGRLIASFEGSERESFHHAALSGDAAKIAASHDARLYLWERSTGRMVWSADTDEDLVPEDNLLGPRDDPVDAIAIDRRGRWVATASRRGWIRFWDADTGRLLHRIEGGAGGPSFESHRPLSISPDSRLIAGVGRWDVRIWNVESGELVARSEQRMEYVSEYGTAYSDPAPGRTPRPVAIRDVWFTPDGASLIVSAEKIVSLDATAPNLRELAALAPNLPERAALSWGTKGVPLSVSPDGRFIALPSKSSFEVAADGRPDKYSRNGTAPQVVDLSGSRVTTQVEFSDSNPLGHFATVSLDGNTLVTAKGGVSFSVDLWDLRSGSLTGRTCNGVEADAWTESPLSTSRSLIALRDRNYDVALCELSPGAISQSLGKEPGSDQKLAISSDGTYYAIATEKHLRIWHIPLRRLVADLPGLEVEALSFAPSGALLAVSYRVETLVSEIALFDAQTGKQVGVFRGLEKSYKPKSRALVFSDDGSRLMAVSDSDFVRLFDLKSRQLMRQSRIPRQRDFTAVSRDLKWIANASKYRESNIVEVIDVEKGQVGARIAVAAGSVTSLAFAADGRRIIAAANDQTIHILDRETGAEVVTLYSDSPDQWIAITPEGFFAGTSKGATLVSVVRGFKAVSANQLFQSLYRPDLVREKLAGDPRGLVKAAAARLNLEKVVDSGKPPRLRMAMAEESEVAAENAIAAVEITNEGGGIGRVEWRIDGVTLGVETPAANGGTIRLSRTFALAPGVNEIEVVAYNGADLVASLPARAVVRHPADPTEAKPRLYVIVVGVNAYENPDWRLNFAVPDAAALAEGLSKSAAGLFSSVNVTRIFDDEVTRARLESVFSDLSTKVRPQDALIFFNAGHGKTVDGRYFFIPPSFKLAGEASVRAQELLEASVRAQGIGQELLQTWFARVAARHSMFLSDTCESGSLTGDQAETSGAARIAALEKLSEATGRIVLTASTEDAPALEGIQGHGLFTFALLDALAHGDSNGNGMLEVSEIERFLRNRIPELSRRYFGMKQTPQTRIVGADFPIGSPIEPMVRGESIAVADARGISPYIVLRGSRPVSAPGAKQGSGDQIARGTKVTVVKVDKNWSLIAYDGRTLGWVPSESLSPVRFH
jgi:WD40 repeat protein/uncharacterized caspase-like protein